MNTPASRADMARNVSLYPWFKFFQNLVFWQAIWFLYFQNELSPSEALLLYVIYDVGTTVLEVPSGYMSDRLGRRLTLIAAAMAGSAVTVSSKRSSPFPSSPFHTKTAVNANGRINKYEATSEAAVR